MAGRELGTPASPVEYAQGGDASAFARMLGGLIEANVAASPTKRRDFESLRAQVSIDVTDIEQAVTLDFRGGYLVVHDGLEPGCDLTIQADADTVMQLSTLRIGFGGMPVYYDATGREVVLRMLTGRLRIEGLLGHLTVLNQVTRIFSVV